jgi:hypothetical protein
MRAAEGKAPRVGTGLAVVGLIDFCPGPRPSSLEARVVGPGLAEEDPLGSLVGVVPHAPPVSGRVQSSRPKSSGGG